MARVDQWQRRLLRHGYNQDSTSIGRAFDWLSKVSKCTVEVNDR